TRAGAWCVGLLLAACGSSGASPSTPAAPRVNCPEPSADPPDDVYCIGLYAGASPKKVSAGVLAYKPGVVLWSDGAEKQRYLALPAGTVIDTSSFDAWVFPVDTKVFKECTVAGKLTETRMLWKQAETNWVMATYIWDDAAKSATRNTSLQPVLLDGGYEIPTAK